MNFLAILAAAVMAAPAMLGAQTLVVNWEITPSNIPSGAGFTLAGDNERGVAINPITGNLLVASRNGSPAQITRLNAETGALLSPAILNNTGVGGGTINLVKVVVAEDGVIYACNLNSAAGVGDLKVYRWADESAAPTVAFNGSIPTRAGDSMIVTGSGAGTKIYVSGSSAAAIYELTTTDGVTFTRGTDITLPTAGDAGMGLALLPNGNFLGNRVGGTVKELSPAGALVAESSGTIVGGSFGNIAVYHDGTNTYLAGQVGNAAPALGRVWDITTGIANAVTVLSTPSQGSATNLNGAGGVAWDPANEALIVLSTNNAVGSYGNAAQFAPLTFPSGPAPTNVTNWMLMD